MSGGTFVRVVAVLALVGVLAVIGVGVYNAGISAGLADAGRTAASSGAPVVHYPGPYAGHPWAWGGFGFFGIFFFILGIFLIFGLIRAAFGWGRWSGGGRDWGRHRGHDYLDDWHRRAHEPTGEAKSQ
jgi:hypothetical protein